LIRHIKLQGSYTEAPLRLGLKQVAFCGRSNVGKSSLINALCSCKIARISKKAGKTTTINAYLVNECFYLVDLPGYGFAHRSKAMVRQWQHLIEDYLRNANLLVHCFVLIDARHEPMESDMRMIEWLTFYNKEYSVVFTKADKAKQSDISRNVKLLEKRFGKIKWFSVSSTKRKGIDKLLEYLFALCCP